MTNLSKQHEAIQKALRRLRPVMNPAQRQELTDAEATFGKLVALREKLMATADTGDRDPALDTVGDDLMDVLGIEATDRS